VNLPLWTGHGFRERKQFWTRNQDLNEAMATLEDAIKKIDMETRTWPARSRRSTATSAACSPVFGGGNAKLMMTGDEVLDAVAGHGATARPKNQTIHLLSGSADHRHYMVFAIS
jgi:chromosome segregation protein